MAVGSPQCAQPFRLSASVAVGNSRFPPSVFQRTALRLDSNAVVAHCKKLLLHMLALWVAQRLRPRRRIQPGSARGKFANTDLASLPFILFFCYLFIAFGY